MADYSMTSAEARSSIQKVAKEANSIDPSAVIDFFEIDTSSIQFDLGIRSSTPDNENDRIFRFHNSVSLTTRSLFFNDKEYIAAPIAVEGFEMATKGTLPRPTLSIAVKPNGVDALSKLKTVLAQIGDLTGAKFTRIRTFAKFIDGADPLGKNSAYFISLIKNHDPDPHAILNYDIYYIDRKTSESNQTLSFEMSSSIDLENFGVPKRLVIQDRCQWNYRGEGCCYTNNLSLETHGTTSYGNLVTRNKDYIPVATYLNERIFDESENNENGALRFSSLHGIPSEWNAKKDSNYIVGDMVYVVKNGIEYHFVCKVEHKPDLDNAPPNTNYWIADQCSKSVQGCKLRWQGVLPYGGFPAVNKA
jgi:lambda family phage minor tail protein L